MLEIIEGWTYILALWANFLFKLDFGDITVGAFLLAAGVMGALINFIFRSTRRGPGNVRLAKKGYANMQKQNKTKGG